MGVKYTYQVARIRVLEAALMTDQDIHQLLSCQDHAACRQLLQEKGWGSANGLSDEEMLAAQEKQVWQAVEELRVEPRHFAVLTLPRLFHNLKAAVKTVCSGRQIPGLYYEGLTPDAAAMEEIVGAGDWDRLPAMLQNPGKEAKEAMLTSGDGQLCDVIVDRACLEEILRSAEEEEEPAVRRYAELTVAAADIRIAVRAMKSGKTAAFLERALAPCRTLNKEALIRAAQGEQKSLMEYLEGTEYREGAEALARGASAFDCWCDDVVTGMLKPQHYSSFGLGPVFAWVLGRFNEIRTVRIILAGKHNLLDNASIRERIRQMYG